MDIELFEYSDYALVPATKQLNAIRAYNDSQRHWSEKVLLRNSYSAWLVEIAAYREFQRAYALRKGKKISFDTAFQDAADASALLCRPMTKRLTRDGQPAFQWLERWKRRELHNGKLAIIHWLAESSGEPIRYLRIPEVCQFINSTISESEFDHAYCNEDGESLALAITVQGKTIATTSPIPLDEPSEVTKLVPNILGTYDKNKTESTLHRTWRYLPSIEESINPLFHKVGPNDPAYPHAEDLEVTQNGTTPLAGWQKQVLVKKLRGDRLSEAEKRRKKELENHRRKLQAPSPDELFEF